jgi:thioredoxin 1
MLTYIVLFTLFSVSFYLIYTYYTNRKKIKTDFVENNEYKEILDTKNGDIYIFYALWCPYSKTNLEKLKQIEPTYKNTKYNLTFNEIDVDTKADMADEYNITSYPTIVLLYNNNKYYYDAELEEDTFKLFLTTIMK